MEAGERSMKRSQSSPVDVTEPVGPKDVHRTTLLAQNIHCNSCVSRIEYVYSLLGSDVLDVRVSIVTGEIHVRHYASITSKKLRDILADEAFEVQSYVTFDGAGREIESELSDREADHRQDVGGNWYTLRRTVSGESWFSSSTRGKRKRHLENCEACRRKEDAEATSTGEQQTQEVSGKGKEKAGLEDELQTWCLTLSVGGMTCASCTSAVTNALEGLDNVESASVDLLTNSATVKFTGQRNYADKIIETVEDIGYDASMADLKADQPVSHEPKTYKATLSIGGMTCASCTNAVTDGLKRLPFVQSVDVVLVSNSATVVFTDRQNADQIVETVEDLGYECTLDTIEEVDNSVAEKSRTRTVQLLVRGMYCEHCPPRVEEALRAKYGDRISINKTPTLNKPIIELSYTPDSPTFTLRHIIATVDSVDKFFSAQPYHPPTIEERSKKMQQKERWRLLLRLALSFIVAIPTFLIGIVWMDLVPSTNSTRMFFEEEVWAGSVTRAEWALFILATPVYLFAADVFHRRAFKEIRSLWRPGSKVPILRRFYRFGSMNLLISAGTTVAYVSSLALLIVSATSPQKPSSSSYFDSVVFLTFFILIGRYLEAVSKAKTGDAVTLLGKLRPEKAQLVTPGPDELNLAAASDDDTVKSLKDKSQQTSSRVKTIEADLLDIGDRVIVPHGSSPPADGTILVGQGRFDESSLTGESRLVDKEIGDKVFVGTINSGDPVTIKITGIGGASMLDQIVTVVREGLAKRAPIERFADVLTAYFVPVITAIAIVVWIIWLALGESGALDEKYLNGKAGGWPFWSLEFAIAVFVVACPCGIGLAAPTALFAGIGLAAKHGILVRGGGEAFQEAPYLDGIAFDKTGTLTEGGDLKVSDHKMLAEDEQLAWAVVSALEEQSAHPIARAIVEFASDKPKVEVNSESVSEVSGRGLRGTFSYKETKYDAAIGSQAFIESLQKDTVSANPTALDNIAVWQSEAKSIALLAMRRVSPDPQPWSLATILATTDPIRPSALPTIKALQSRGLAVYMVSGDNAPTARAVGKALGIPEANVFGGVLPTEKADKIEELKRTVRRRNTKHRSADPSLKELENGTGDDQKARIAFVGDGTNDAPALLAASTSIAVSSGSPAALASASFVLLSRSDPLASVPRLLDLSSRVLRRVKLNFGWALVYNVILVPVAAGVFFKVKEDGWRLGPVWAAVAMAGSSVSVVLSSLALRWEGNSSLRRK